MNDIHDDLFRKIVDTFYKAVIVLDSKKNIIYWNPAAEKITGFMESEALRGKCYEMDIDGREMCGTEKCPINRLESGKGSVELYVKVRHREGYGVPVLSRMWPIKYDHGEKKVFVNTFMSLSTGMSAYEKIEQLEELVYVDGLTGVMNRRYAESRIADRIVEFRNKTGGKFGLIFLDIDNFKNINDSCNHEIGDRVIQFIAMTITEDMGGIDFVARWGGEEFIVVVNMDDDKYVGAIAERFRAALEKLRVESGKEGLKVTASLGVTMVREDDDAGRLVARADSYMYLSKKSGKNAVTAG